MHNLYICLILEIPPTNHIRIIYLYTRLSVQTYTLLLLLYNSDKHARFRWGCDFPSPLNARWRYYCDLAMTFSWCRIQYASRMPTRTFSIDERGGEEDGKTFRLECEIWRVVRSHQWSSSDKLAQLSEKYYTDLIYIAVRHRRKLVNRNKSDGWREKKYSLSFAEVNL